MKKLIGILSVCIFSVFLMVSVSAASVLNFDDLSDGAHLAATGYAGFNWNPDYIYAESQGNFTGRGGLSTFPSASISVYNGYGVSVSTISNTNAFDFNGAYFANWDHTDLPGANSVIMKGYLNNALVGSTAQYELSTDFNWVEANFANIDRLEIVVPDTSGWWLMDNFTYNEPIQIDPPNGVVPEPATMLLFGTGLVGAFLRKRKA